MSSLPAFLPAGSVTGIGSLPFTDPEAAVRFVAQMCPEVPFWPQLPRLSSHEYMLDQVLDLRSSFFVSRATGYGYQLKPGLLSACLQAFLAGDATLHPDSAAGFFAFERMLASGAFTRAQALKGQLVGPVTLACNLFTEEAAFLFDPECLHALGQHIVHLALWQMRRLQQWQLPVICFLDEPCLALLEHEPFKQMATVALQTLRSVIVQLQAVGILVGVHCCAGQTSFQPICQLAPDILSFDAYQDLETFCHDPSARTFLNTGGLTAFGLVPTSTVRSDLDPSALFTRWLLACQDLGDLDLRQIVSRSLLTATCGLGLLTPQQATATFQATRDLATLIAKAAQDSILP